MDEIRLAKDTKKKKEGSKNNSEIGSYIYFKDIFLYSHFIYE